MAHNDALLAGVIAAPDDDLPRLVYADWLEEAGDGDRAEFIRVQCRLAAAPGDPDRAALEAREADLLARRGHEWALPLGPAVREWVYRRGFVERVETSLETTGDAIRELLAKAPIRHVRDTGQFCDLSGVNDALPALSRLTGLEFWGLYAFDDALLNHILQSEHLANLRTLILYHDRNGNLADDAVIAAALRSPHRANLDELAVNIDDMWRGPSPDVLRALADSPHLRGLRKLSLSHAGDPGHAPGLDADLARRLGRSPNLANLEELDLARTRCPLDVWDEVLRWPCLSNLKWLRLHAARQVNPGDRLTVAEVHDLPAYRAAFEALTPGVDWDTEFADPWNADRCWRGQSWDGLADAHLFAMEPFVTRGDYAGLEAKYRADCVRFAGDEAAAAVDALPFARYEADLRPALAAALRAAADRADAAAVYLSLRADLPSWHAEFFVSPEPPPDPFVPHRMNSYSGRLDRLPAPGFPEAAAVRGRFHPASPLDPGGVRHCLFARAVAALGRAATGTAPAVPVVISGDVAFLIAGGSGPS